jgi:hypothetical protein
VITVQIFKKILKSVAKALFCLLLSWALLLITVGHILIYLGISLPIGIIAIPVAAAMFMLFTKIEKSSVS